MASFLKFCALGLLLWHNFAIAHPHLRLAYQIQKQDDGYYAVFNLLAPAGAMDEVERNFRLSDDVLRHKLLRLPDDEAARRGMISAA